MILRPRLAASTVGGNEATRLRLTTCARIQICLKLVLDIEIVEQLVLYTHVSHAICGMLEFDQLLRRDDRHAPFLKAESLSADVLSGPIPVGQSIFSLFSASCIIYHF